MGKSEELTPRKETFAVNSNLSIEKIIQSARAVSSEPEAPPSITEEETYFKNTYGLSVEVIKLIDAPQGVPDTKVRVTSAKDFNFVECRSSEILSLPSKLLNIGFADIDADNFRRLYNLITK